MAEVAAAPVAEPVPALQPDPGIIPTVEAVIPDPAEAEATTPDDPAKPKRKGWWSIGR